MAAHGRERSRVGPIQEGDYGRAGPDVLVDATGPHAPAGSPKALCVLAAVAVGTTACAQEADPADVAVGEVETEATPAIDGIR